LIDSDPVSTTCRRPGNHFDLVFPADTTETPFLGVLLFPGFTHPELFVSFHKTSGKCSEAP